VHVTTTLQTQGEALVTQAGCNVLLVFPRFDGWSFWNIEVACKVAGRRCAEPPLGLITVAALLPPDWNVQLVDRNAQELGDNQLAWADLVMTGGMIPQQPDTLRIIDLCNARGKPVVVGGPDVTSSPHLYERADFRVLGEAESVIEAFARAWNEGVRSGVFAAEQYKTDVTASPVPRFDLLNLDHYLGVGIQFSRGCPFTCEFCDIIELYGRVPRTKTVAQMLAELDALYRIGHRGSVNLVDDNLIGNKKAVKGFLPHLAEWQRQRGYPFAFVTQASINLADDDALLGMMREANLEAVFIGIESPNDEILISMHKKQNARRNLSACIHKIYAAGLFVTAGFIIGFDSEKNSVADEMIACIEAAAIPVCMVGMLTALPNTQLTRRLAREGRLRPDQDISFFDPSGGSDQCTAGLNFATARPRRDILNDYRLVLERIYEPTAFFGRLRRMGGLLDRPKLGTKTQAKALLNDLRTLGRLTWRLATRHPELIKPFSSTLIDCAFRNPAALKQVVSQMVMYLHVGPFSRYVVNHLDRHLAMVDTEDRRGPVATAPVTVVAPGPDGNIGKAVAASR